MRFSLTLLLLGSTIVFADDATAPGKPSPVPFLLQSIEEKYTTEASKADGVAAKAEVEAVKTKRLANEARLKAYRDKLTEVTKTGDFEKAQQVKARIDQIESESASDNRTKPEKPSKKSRPKDTVKFGGHTYALVKDPAPWHVAKQRCEDMGGHLVTLESQAEAQFVASLCTTTDWTWGGATDEEEEGRWMWVTGKPVGATAWITMDLSDDQHYLGFHRGTQKWYDCNEEHRVHYVCEWDK